MDVYMCVCVHACVPTRVQARAHGDTSVYRHLHRPADATMPRGRSAQSQPCRSHNYIGHNYIGHNYICRVCDQHRAILATIMRACMAWRGVHACIAWRGVLCAHALRGVARRGVEWRGVSWHGVAWRGMMCLALMVVVYVAVRFETRWPLSCKSKPYRP